MFEYRVNWYNEFEDKEVYARGLVEAHTYKEAMDNVFHDYGETSIIDIYLQALEDGKTIELDAIKRQFKLN